jgi:hypothetical protein
MQDDTISTLDSDRLFSQGRNRLEDHRLHRRLEPRKRDEEDAITTRSDDEASIVALRDDAMAMLKQGAWHDDGKGHRLLIRETEDLRLAYAGPLQVGQEIPEEMKYFAAATGRSGHLPHELSVWRKAPSRKVLNVTWDDAGKIELIAYEPGKWEEHLGKADG